MTRNDSFRRWWHPLLVFSCNSSLLFLFLPGRPALWMILTAVGLFFCLGRRSADRGLNFLRTPAVSYALMALAAVVGLTACFSGGIGWANQAWDFGARRYLEVLLGIALYFVLSSAQISRERARWYVGLYFLSALVGLAGSLAVLRGPVSSLLEELIPARNGAGTGVLWLGILAAPAGGLFCFLLARHGIRGLLNPSRPWRILLLLLALAGCLFSGLRSEAIVFALVFLAVFWMEGLLFTRYLVGLLLGVGLAAVLLLPNIRHLPPATQRALSFLPVKTDAAVQAQAAGLSKQRFQIWSILWKDVPRHLMIGKGYQSESGDRVLMETAPTESTPPSTETIRVMGGNVKNGPLSVLIPFGVPGTVAFLWFLAAAGWALHKNYARGAADLRGINRVLLGVYWVLVFRFVFIYGTFFSDLPAFCGLLGLAVSLNGGSFCQKQFGGAPAPSPVLSPTSATPRPA